MSSTARATATEQRTCSTCAHYMVSRDNCTEWGTPTRASATCERWLATHGVVEREPDDRVLFRASLKSGVQVDRITRREVTMDVAEETVTQLSSAPAGVDRIADLEVKLQKTLGRMDEYEWRITEMQLQIDRLAAEIARLQQDKPDASQAERVLRIVEAALLGTAERRPVA